MTTTISPWSPYEGRTSIVSGGRKTLTSAFSDLIVSRQGFQSYELPEIFSATVDDGENDAARDLVRLETERMSRLFANGRLTSFARPLGGGEITAITPELWEIDDPLLRFATGALNLEHWADESAEPTHRIFVDGQQFDGWLASLKPLGPLSNRQVAEIVDPQLRAARSVAKRSVEREIGQGDSAVDGHPREVTSPPGVGPELLTVEEVSTLISRSVSSIYDYENKGQFPERVKIGASSRWLKTEVLAWIAEQAAKRGKS
ncbi:helix-turn-helix transcriptional regulator [Citromicrobium bathyomarinum]|uniref:helix-turn-helix transcriptional regulator n=1 Tax=Citromicrobium bathyomarinum TaxID=72174 RepID=UPI001E43562D|nr:AlpA family phage regulatory protein [Citromicrobium bathyomarinum]MCD1623499.1 AlpA family phage regulatory protein [Citromicrobium bathyomarinum]